MEIHSAKGQLRQNLLLFGCGLALGGFAVSQARAEPLSAKPNPRMVLDGILSGLEHRDPEAYDLYLKASTKNDAESQVLLGGILYEGCRVPKNKEEALKWYRKSAEQGNEAAQEALGRHYFFHSQEVDQALKWYRMAADQGNTDAFVGLGFLYDNLAGEQVGLDKDAGTNHAADKYAEAYFWYSLAAKNEEHKKGHASAFRARFMDNDAQHLTSDQRQVVNKRVDEWKPINSKKIENADVLSVADKTLALLPHEVEDIIRRENKNADSSTVIRSCELVGEPFSLKGGLNHKGYFVTTSNKCGWYSFWGKGKNPIGVHVAVKTADRCERHNDLVAPIWILDTSTNPPKIELTTTSYNVKAMSDVHHGRNDLKFAAGSSTGIEIQNWIFDGEKYVEDKTKSYRNP